MKERKKMATFDFNLNTRNYSLENAYWLSRASQLAYGRWCHTLIIGVPREGYCFLTGERPVVVKAGAM